MNKHKKLDRRTELLISTCQEVLDELLALGYNLTFDYDKDRIQVSIDQLGNGEYIRSDGSRILIREMNDVHLLNAYKKNLREIGQEILDGTDYDSIIIEDLKEESERLLTEIEDRDLEIEW